MHSSRVMGATIVIGLFVILSLIATLVGGQKYQPLRVGLEEQLNEEPSGGNQDEAGERVDKLVSPSGDLYWRTQEQDWYQQALAKSQQQNQASEMQPNQLIRAVVVPTSLRRLGQDRKQPWTETHYDLPFPELDNLAGARNYNTMVNDFKQWSRVANPTRESRAFKPKLMSTARGFGKRTPMESSSQVRGVALADLFGSADHGAPSSPDNKLSGNSISLSRTMDHSDKFEQRNSSPKHSDWIDQMLSRWPSMSKFMSEKSNDYNG